MTTGQFQTAAGIQPVRVAVLGDGHALDKFHYEIGTTRVCCPCAEHIGDVGMVHDRQGLALDLEAGDDLTGGRSRTAGGGSRCYARRELSFPLREFQDDAILPGSR